MDGCPRAGDRPSSSAQFEQPVQDRSRTATQRRGFLGHETGSGVSTSESIPAEPHGNDNEAPAIPPAKAGSTPKRSIRAALAPIARRKTPVVETNRRGQSNLAVLPMQTLIR
jgi:hypothetical protein